jgi:hypothetical protein
MHKDRENARERGIRRDRSEENRYKNDKIGIGIELRRTSSVNASRENK